MPNDDLELQAMYVAALDRMEHPEINREILAEIWVRHMNFHCDEYAVAMRNLALGIRPPWSGSYDNFYINGMGAAIRSELWACLAPGNPELAVRFAREDACIDHAGDGVDAEVYLAALESLAFVETDLRMLIEAALSYLPKESLLAEGIRSACTLWDTSGNWGAGARYALRALRHRIQNRCPDQPSLHHAGAALRRRRFRKNHL
ncbi:MAG: ADP-ribosylglycohydrolase family protein [Lentisphaeria bacterium]|nr:MAG: ADP-ribosylglycohydrolase family protein [Lentisphaeria bacterium]